jgi:hypothetical protein
VRGASTVRKEGSRLIVEGAQGNGIIRAPVAILGTEYELAVQVGGEFGSAVLMRVPFAGKFFEIAFNSSGYVGRPGAGANSFEIMPAGRPWIRGQPVIIKLRVKLDTSGGEDELEAKVGDQPSAIWKGRLANLAPGGNQPEPQTGLNITADMKAVDAFTLRMIQGEAKLTRDGAWVGAARPTEPPPPPAPAMSVAPAQPPAAPTLSKVEPGWIDLLAGVNTGRDSEYGA